MSVRFWANLAAVAVLFAGVTNAHAHVHMCFDGQEPSASVHLVDGIDDLHGVHGDQASQHDDVDVDLQDHAIAKTLKHDLAAVLPIVLLTIALERPAAQAPPVYETPPAAPDRPYSHPQLRAPPR